MGILLLLLCRRLLWRLCGWLGRLRRDLGTCDVEGGRGGRGARTLEIR